ncbi:S-methyl-5'-thioadenosine phosphorylase [Micromonospora sp. WMMD1120]|uniref:S-methyl-5'-thioadenosine phosphorylase n=1 Tax=Micromonospora sp. WMMD1120 TaxID=3016106 RepID=UPI00241714ED|nr:S-methyl-5'-thioadenosine phosphorylase [Micromonospora sp. WMMD1120]MDG4810920.1 S-methyl-5'-thioadenosine phosphorylase [Micromonospora sp. WMMD1120]
MAAEATPVEGPRIGVIGGSGFYEFLDEVTEVAVDTPYGAPSDQVSIGGLAGREVAFLPRHGRRHALPPHRINYRANLWALRALGVRQILAPGAVGGLQPELGPGTLVIPDQLVDRTSGREQTYHDGRPGTDGQLPQVVHAPFADPYCPVGRATVLDSARRGGWSPVDGGTMVVIAGPRFSTRAESRWYAREGWTVVGMTGHPEAVLARELGLCYTALSLVTDRDSGVEAGQGVTQQEVFAVFARNVDRLRVLLAEALGRLPAGQVGCACAGH